jgi:tetratricopeptide (TPR) repeat protein
MSRWWIGLAFCAVAAGQQANLPEDESKSPPASQKQDDAQLPPDEDKSSPQPKQYTFNPLQSKREMGPGEFYFKKGDYRAAAGRFSEATKWNPGNAEAWLRLGDAQEKMRDLKAAREAYAKYLQLAPDAKNAAEVKKKVEKLKD